MIDLSVLEKIPYKDACFLSQTNQGFKQVLTSYGQLYLMASTSMNQWPVSYASYFSVHFVPQLSKSSGRADLLLQLESAFQHKSCTPHIRSAPSILAQIYF